MAGYAERADIDGLVWLVGRHDEVHVGTAGSRDGAPDHAVRRDSIFRISSMTKPIVAVAALTLIEEGRLRLDEPVDRLLPELADRRVLRHSTGPLDDTVPAKRPITVDDVLTLRLGLGMDLTAWREPQPTLEAIAALGLGVGPPAPAGPPGPDEWMRRLGTVPLARQPGERWLYQVGADVLGVLVARAADQPLDTVLRERVFTPLGMRDTGFSVPPADLDRFGTCSGIDPTTGEAAVFDPVDGQWTQPPAFPSGGAGLVSTVDDYRAFAEMLRGGGTRGGQRILGRSSVEAMTTDHLSTDQRVTSGPEPDGALGWGYGVCVRVRAGGPAEPVGRYGWDGGLGSSWANDPAADLTGILLTTQTWSSPVPPPVCQDFWTGAYAAIAD
jgi:CubicO group peptidase (beta-lactamase class C family)